MTSVVTVVGARPQFVKAAVVSEALRAAGLDEAIIHTGQHTDPAMSGALIEELGVPAPAINLEVSGGGHGPMTGRMLERLEPVLQQLQPRIVLVYGDTNSTLAGGLTAAKLGIPVAHVEAGLRSFVRDMPEEINRVLVDHLSTLLFCPTSTAVENLRCEGVLQGVHEVGDVMYDSVLRARSRAPSIESLRQTYGFQPGPYVVATVHRAATTNDAARLREVLDYLKSLVTTQSVLLPLHPRTRIAIERHGLTLDGITVLPPLGYLPMIALVAGAQAVVTDSGGVQKEAAMLGVECVTLRDETEWPETIDAGWNRLWREPNYKPRRKLDAYGQGDAGTRIAAELVRFLRR